MIGPTPWCAAARGKEAHELPGQFWHEVHEGDRRRFDVDAPHHAVSVRRPPLPVRNDEIDVAEELASLQVVPAAVTIDELVRGLNAMGVSPRDLIAILQAVKAAGALDAQLELL